MIEKNCIGGASPLTRGKRRARGPRRRRTGRIPAHAGKTLRTSWAGSPTWAHPRSRGENRGLASAQAGARGASPLTRGKHVCGGEDRAAGGRIPAHAGKTLAEPTRTMTLRAHPRSRGENRLIHWPTRTLVGASPLTRGKLAGRHARRYAHGRIPAHAGKTFLLVVREIETGAHPRSRGENTRQISSVAWAMGASPLTRGKLRGLDEGSELPGRIPAHAGKTAWGGDRSGAARAHPRSRGENPPLERTNIMLNGASPLTRGKRRQSRFSTIPSGRIPAHAGKTTWRYAWPRRWGAHPRSRGENQ